MNLKRPFFLSVALSCCINEVPMLSLLSAKVPILLPVPRVRDAESDCFANEHVALSLVIAVVGVDLGNPLEE